MCEGEDQRRRAGAGSSVSIGPPRSAVSGMPSIIRLGPRSDTSLRFSKRLATNDPPAGIVSTIGGCPETRGRKRKRLPDGPAWRRLLLLPVPALRRFCDEADGERRSRALPGMQCGAVRGSGFFLFSH